MHLINRNGHYHIYYCFQGKPYRKSGKVFNNGNPVKDKSLARTIRDRIGDAIEENIEPVEFFERLHHKEEKKTYTLRSYRDEYMKWSMSNRASWKTDTFLYQRLLDFFKDKPMAKISEKDVDDFIGHYKSKVSSSTLYHYLATLSIIYTTYNRHHKENQIIKPTIHWPKIESKKKPSIPDKHLKKILKLASPHLKRFILIGRFTGARPSEILRLQGKHIILGTTGKKYFYFEKTKTKKPRSVPVNKTLNPLLKNIGHEEYLVNFEGHPLDAHTIARAMTRICEQLKLPVKYTPYCLRHTVARDLIQKNDIYTVKQYLGHSDIETTAIYLAEIPENLVKACQSLKLS